ncbi:MAG: M4 family metallopeptidase [Flavobacteriales bacterium]|nr:M4 family metallopeptidase [Flavobacteriales bacterium]
MKNYILSFLILCALTIDLSAQRFEGNKAQEIIPEAKSLTIDRETGLVKLCVFGERLEFNEKSIDRFSEMLRLNPSNSFEEISTQKDKLGFEHIKFRQFYFGIPIEYSSITFHLKEGKWDSFSGDYWQNVQVDIKPLLSESLALVRARQEFPANQFKTSQVLELCILPYEGDFKLVYKVDHFALDPMFRKFLYISAIDGELVKSVTRIHHVNSEGEAETRYSGLRTITTDSTSSGFRLRDYTRGEGIITRDLNSSTSYSSAADVYDDDNYWEETDYSADASLDAHWGTEQVYDYFLDVHGRDSYDGNGASINSYVDYGSSYSNAFWNGEAMTYGAGGGGDNPFPSLDVVAHEIVHGLTEYSAGLIYSYESGALNESFSDVFGIVVDFYARGDEYANYEMAEEIRTPPIRSMSDPNSRDCPDTYQGDFWVFGSFDNGGVHFNSGVQNFWFYLLVEGGAGVNDNGDSYSVNSIGMDAAAAIAYRNLTVYLSPNSQYEDARTFSIQSAIDLYGECSEEVIAVTNAWQAVGVGEVFDNAVVAAFDYSNNFFCQIPATIDFTDFSNNANEYLWDFGDGETSNEENPSHTYTASGVYTVTLEVSGEAGCSTADTLELIDLITIVEEGGPVSPACSPSSSTTSLFSGIQQFNLLSFDNSSEAADVGYEDFSCTHLSEGTSGTFHDLTVTLYGAEYLKIWIDLDANGAFTASEIIYQSETAENFHVSSLLLPSTELYDEPLRLRVMSSSISSFDACSITSAGQVEDYTLVLLENFDPPSADFVASDLNVQPSESVFYTDLSSNIPVSWEWYFEGGVP